MRDSRLRVVDERLDFLPHGLVRRIRAIMADGFLSTSERDAFLAKLEAEHGMTRSQRGAVRMIIESWHGQDHRA